jgi:hypothetical protein
MPEQGLECKKREMHAEASRKFQNFLEYQKEILNLYVLALTS